MFSEAESCADGQVAAPSTGGGSASENHRSVKELTTEIINKRYLQPTEDGKHTNHFKAVLQ
jgi:hypothetical protein